MSFSFSFEGNDIDGDDQDPVDKDRISPTANNASNTIAPKRWSLTELLELLPSQISYNALASALEGTGTSPGVKILRRSLFDIRAQLMAEANPEENQNDKLLSGLDAGDLTSGQYEGGFKTWECAIDLAKEVASLHLQGKWHVIELGAGSALPSLTLLQAALRNGPGSNNTRFTLCDYNEDVLKLCTAPNVLLNCYFSNRRNLLVELDSRDRDLDLEAALPQGPEQIQTQLKQSGIAVDFVSGPWCEEFVNLVRPSAVDGSLETILVLASETIYSPASLEAFTRTVMELLKSRNTSSRALVAAKKVYFGVGGGIEEFSRCVHEAGGRIQKVTEGRETGVGRVILEVTSAPLQ
jgi:protein-histidine N-methyltransferase